MSDTTQTHTEIRKVFAPTGTLRASINIGNAVLARQDLPEAAPYGVTIDIAHALADRLGVPIEFRVFPAAQQSVGAVAEGDADIGFFAIDPKRGESIAFTKSYLHIEGWYAVRDESPIKAIADVDQPGIRVAVGNGSAYDLFLSRELKRAELHRAPNPKMVTPLFIDQGLEVAAGVKQQLEMDMQRYAGLRLLPERFMVIRQAMGLARNRGEAAHAYLSAFVEDLKAGDFLAKTLAKHAIQGANLVPPGTE